MAQLWRPPEGKSLLRPPVKCQFSAGSCIAYSEEIVTKFFIGKPALLCAALVACSFSVLHAQDATSGSISGTITDPTGALVKGATVTLTNTDRGQVVRTVTTNAAGYYSAPALPLGHYTVTISDAGFRTEVISGVMLHVNDALTISHPLATGSNTETVNVEGQSSGIDLQDATSAGLINSTQINELVMVSRNYESLMTLQPGVAYGNTTDNLQRGPVGVNGASSVVNYSVNGARDTSNNWTIDGADNLDRGANLTLYVYPSPDAIAEFKTLRGQYSAEYGRNAAGQVDVVIKSGTNKFHGSAYEYLRNDFFDANNYYLNYLGGSSTTAGHIPKYRYNDFGFTIGGPVWLPHIYNGRDKTFFFVSENWLREVTYGSGSAIVPTAAERAGDFSNAWYQTTSGGAWQQGPVNVCTAYTTNPTTQQNTCTAYGTKVTNISPTAAAYLKDIYSIIPLPNEQANVALKLDPHTISTTIPNRYPNLDTVIRIDHEISKKLNVFYSYVHDTFPDFIGSGTFVAVPIPGLSGTISKNPGTQHLAKGTFAFSPTMVLNVGYAYSNGSINTVPQGALQQSASPDIKATTAFPVTVGLVPTIAVGGFQSIGGSAVYNDHGINHQVFADLTKVIGAHSFKFGASYSHYEKQENSTSGNNQGSFGFTNDATFTVANPTPPPATLPFVPLPTGVSTYTTGITESQAFANFLTGNANNGFSQGNRVPAVDMNQAIYEAYAQDNWRVTPRLTLDIGLRYGYVTPPRDLAGYGNNFDPEMYSASKAPTISAATGLITSTAGADYVGVNYLNGLIFQNPSAANNNQSSPFGQYTNTMQKSDLAPRFGFSYDVYGDGKTALRGGYGWVFDELEVSYWETTDFNNPPAIQSYSVLQTSLDNPAGGNSASTPATGPGRIQATPLHAATPYIQQYSLDLQQQFSSKFFMDIGYFGTHGTHLAGAEEINQPIPGAWRGKVDPRTANPGCVISPGSSQVAFITSACDIVLNAIKPYQGYFAIDAMRTIFSSNYNALQVKANKKFSGLSYIDANFTWSRDLTNSPADYSGFIQNIYNPNGDYGRAADDRKLILTVDAVYEMPWFREQHGLVGHLVGGWELSGIYSAASGLPITVSASGGSPVVYNTPAGPVQAFGSNPTNVINDNAGLSVLGNTNAGLRLNQVSDPNESYNGVSLRNTHAPANKTAPSFNTAAFEAQDPTSDIPGTARRGTINGPGYQTLDVGIFRNFKIYESLKMQFRAEAYNVANHTNINTYQASAVNTNFGLITPATSSYRDPRILQFALRFDF